MSEKPVFYRGVSSQGELFPRLPRRYHYEESLIEE